MTRPLEIDMCAGSQLRDTQGEMLNVEGADISELENGRGRINDNHGKGFFNCLGKVLSAKRIFKLEDCEDERQKYYWEKVKSPYVYVKAQLFNDEDHPNARAAAAILRNIHKTDCPLKVKASVEGGVVSRGISDPALLARTKIHSVALTFVPANQATLVEPLNLDKSGTDFEADMTLIKSVVHLAQTSVPSFRHITRDASAEKIEKNINEIIAALGNDAAVSLKQELIKDSLESKVIENVVRINELVKAELHSADGDTLNKSLKGKIAAGLIGAAAYSAATSPDHMPHMPKNIHMPKMANVRSMLQPKADLGPINPDHQKVFESVAAEDPVLGAVAQVESAGGRNYNHQPDKNGWRAGGMFGMRPTAAAFVLRSHPELAEKYPELAEAAKDLNKNHATLTERFNKDPEVAAEFAKAYWGRNKEKTKNLNMLIHAWNHGLKGTWDRYKGEGQEAIDNDEYVGKVLKAMKHLPKKQPDQQVAMKKTLTAGYGGSGTPSALTGGGVIQSESMDLGPKKFKYIVCDDCGHEQVYGKYQVKCREPECGKAFSMAKLEKFFQTHRN